VGSKFRYSEATRIVWVEIAGFHAWRPLLVLFLRISVSPHLVSIPVTPASASAVARLALLKGKIIFDCALNASGEFLSAFRRVQSALVRQDISGELATLFFILWGHSTLWGHGTLR